MTGSLRKSPLASRESLWGYLMILPVVLGLGVFYYVAMVEAFGISFTQWDILSPAKWVGLDNYTYLLQDKTFRLTLWNTIRFTLMAVPMTLFVALLLALALNTKIRFRSLYRLLYFLPALTMPVAVSYVWKWIYNYQYGLFNIVLQSVGLSPVNWLGNINVAMLSVVIEAVWLGAGYQMVIFLAGLQNIPREYYEAAIVDGAGSFQRFLNITLPLLTPVIFFNMVVSFIGAFQQFDIVYVLTRGAPMNTTRTMVYAIYQDGFTSLLMGRATAEGWILFFVILVFTIIEFRMQRRWVIYE